MEAVFLLALHAARGPWLDRLFLLSHDLGTFWFCAPLVLAMAFWHLRRGEPKEARLWVLVGLSTYAIQESLKRLVSRPRPDLWPPLVEVGPWSFPSGHALVSATLFPLLAFDLTRAVAPAPRRAAMGAAILAMVLVGSGRLYLGVHWPTDVVAGWALGALQSWVAMRTLRASGPGLGRRRKT